MENEEMSEWMKVWHLAINETDLGKQLEYFEQAVEAAKEEKSIDGELASEAGISMVEAIAKEKGVVFRGSGVMQIIYKPSVLLWSANPTHCTSLHDFREAVGNQDWGISWQPMFPNGLWYPGFRIPLPPALGNESKERSDRDGTLVVSKVISLTDQVNANAGMFSNCIKIETAIRYDEGGKSETAWSWFAPETGLVKEQYNHSDGDETLTQLEKCSVSINYEFGLPLGIGSQWEYQASRKSNPVISKHVIWVKFGNQGAQPETYIWMLPYYTYSILS